LAHERTKCIVVLSSKSAGSSALQNLLTSSGRVRHVRRTRHNEHETLYWTKAASVLGLPQADMADSEVPIPARRARRELERFLRDNVGGGFEPPTGDRELVFGGWAALCREYAPVFIEKTPHHLHQRAALELILECERTLDAVDFMLVGLVRNPMDALYSMWNRRRETPEVHQFEWLEAYSNLRWLASERPDLVTTVRYEDMVVDPSVLEPVCAFAGIDVPDRGYMHGRSIAKWRDDPGYGFVIDPEVASLAREFGYSDDEVRNEPAPGWSVRRRLVRWPYIAVRPARIRVRAVRKRVRER
jgi:hypothetical protein